MKTQLIITGCDQRCDPEPIDIICIDDAPVVPLVGERVEVLESFKEGAKGNYVIGGTVRDRAFHFGPFSLVVTVALVDLDWRKEKYSGYNDNGNGLPPSYDFYFNDEEEETP